MQTSFIPKKPITESADSGSGISLFLLLSVIVFIVSLAMAGGVYMWKGSLVTKIEQDKQDLVAAKASYEEPTINALIRLDDRLKVSNMLLQKHLAITPVFLLLEKNVLKNVRLKTMKFSYGTGDKIKVELTGNAQSYEVLSKQGDAFGAENLRTFVSQPVISDFNPTTDGSIAFNFSTFVTPNLISYAAIADMTNSATNASSTNQNQ